MFKRLLATTALTVLFAAPATAGELAKTDNSQEQRLTVTTVAIDYMLSADEIIGQPVRNAKGESLGSVEDLIVTRDDHVVMAILSVGGFLGIGDKLIAVTYEELQRTDDGFVMYDTTRHDLEAAGRFKYGHDSNLERERYLRSVERRLDKWGDRIERTYRSAQADAKAGTEQATTELKDAWEATKEKMRELRESSSETWDDARRSFEESMNDLSRAWDDATS